MSNLKKIKSVISYVSRERYNKPLTCLNVRDNTASVTDLETSIIFKDTFGLKDGLYPVVDLNHSIELDGEYPKIDERFKTLQKLIISRKSLETLIKYASKDYTRSYLNGIYFDETRAVANDGYSLRYVEIEGLKEGKIIPRKSIEILIKLLKAYKCVNAFIHFDNNYAYVDNSLFHFQSHLINREYIKYQGVIPKKFNYKFIVNNFPNEKLIKSLIVDKNKARCSILGNDNKVYLKISDQSILIGECNENFEIGFNPLYLIRSAEGCNKFIVEYNGNLHPVKVNESILMPLKL